MRRAFLVFLAILSLCSCAFAQSEVVTARRRAQSVALIALINHKSCTTANNNGCTTAAVSMTGANFLVMEVSFNTFGGSGSAPTVSDSSSNTWFGPFRWCDNGACGSGNNNVAFYFAPNAIVSASQTFTCNTSGEYPGCASAGFSNVNTSSPFGQKSTANSSSTVTTLANGSLTPLTSNSLFVTSLAEGSTSASGTPSIGGTFSLTDAFAGAATDSNTGGGMGYYVQGTAAAENPSWSWTTARAAATLMASFMPSSVGNAYTLSVDVENSSNNTTLTAAILAGGMTAGDPLYPVSGNWTSSGSPASAEFAATACQDAQVTGKNIAGNTYTDSAGTLGIEFNDAASTAFSWQFLLPVPQGTLPDTVSSSFRYYANIGTSDAGYYSHNLLKNVAGDFISLMIHSGSMYLESALCPNCAPDAGSAYSYATDTWYGIDQQFVGYVVNGTSTTSLTIGTGTQTITTQSGLGYVAGQAISIADSAGLTNWMSGSVTSYSGTSLVVNVVNTNGSGTIATWNLSGSAHTLKIYSATGTLLSTQQKVSDPSATGGPTAFTIGRGGDSGTTAGNFTCTDGYVLAYQGAPIFPIPQ